MRAVCWGLLVILIPLLCVCPAPGAAPFGHVWSHGFDARYYYLSAPLAVDVSGNVIIAGIFDGSVDFGGGPLTAAGFWEDIFVVKFDASGNHAWSKRFGDLAKDVAESVVVDASGSVVVVGNCSSDTVDFGGGPLTGDAEDLFVAKFDAEGDHIWSKRFATSVGRYCGAVDPSGNVIIAGNFIGVVNFGGVPLLAHPSLGPEIFVVKFDVAGNHIWSKRFGGVESQDPRGVAVDASGSIVLTGYFFGSLNFGGGSLTSAAGTTDIFVAKLDSGGNHVWSHDFGDAGFQFGNRLALDASGGVAMTGQFAGSVDFGGGTLASAGGNDIFVTKFDAAGNHVWSHGFGDSDFQSGYGVAVDGSGNVIVTGEFSGMVDFGGGPLTSAGGGDIFVAKFDAGGNYFWGARHGDAVGQAGYGVAADGSGHVIVTGPFGGTVDFGGEPLTAGGSSLFVVKYNPDAVTGVGEDDIPRAVYLMQNVPNPFTPDTRITFGLRDESVVSLRVYDASGRLVRVLMEGHRGPGPHVVPWNGDDESQRKVPSGVYFCRLEAGGETLTRKLVVVR